MKKIALVISSLRHGGGERVVSTLSKEFAKNHQVFIILFDAGNRHYEYGGEILDLKSPDKKNMPAKAFNIIARSVRLRALIKKHQFDHVFGFMESANFACALASKKSLLSVHINYDFLNAGEKWLLKHLYKRAKQVLAVSDDMAVQLRQKAALNNVSRVYNPVDSHELQVASNDDHELVDHPLYSLYQQEDYIIAVGRLTYQKHFDLLVDAYAKSDMKQHCKLVILGEGELRAELEEQVARLGLQDSVFYPGRVNNPFPFYKQAKFMALSSYSEGFPMVLIEAMAMGLPVLSVDCPTGPREIIKDGHNGRLIEMDNRAALSNSLDELYYDESLREKFSDNAQQSVAHLSPESICKQWLEYSTI